MSTNYISQITASNGTTYDIQEGVTTRIFRATCSTANATAAKVATLDDSTGYSLAAGVRVAVTFTYGNTATSPTLNVNSGGAKYIYYRTDISSAQKVDELCVWGANETVIFTYNGSSWVMMGSSLALYNAYNKAASSGSGTITEVKTNAGAHTTIDVLSGKAEFNVPTTAAHVGAATSDHAHGNITNGGDITATAPTIASGDQIIINDNSVSKITNGPTFDGSTTTKALTKKGTWETFATSDTNTTYTLSNALSSHKFTETLTAGGSGSGTSTATMEFVAGTGITLTDDTTNKKITIASNVTNTDKKLELEEVANATVYYPVVGSGTTANVRQYDATGFKYVPQNGSASSDGSATLTLGNSTASGTVGNKQGKLVLYGTTAYTHTIVGAPTSNKTITLPDETGTVALTSDVTDKKVKQTNNTTSNANLRILFSTSAIDTDQTSGVNKSSDFTYNPSTKALSTGGPINGYALAAASAKDVDTSIGAASASTNLPTSAAVAAFVEGKGYITETTVTSSGSGNVVTGMTASNGVITYTMGTVSTTAAQIIRW